MRRFADTLVAYLIVIIVGLKSAILMDDIIAPTVGNNLRRRAPGWA